jgi:hypothetical protein
MNEDGTVNVGGEWLTTPQGKDVYMPPKLVYENPVNRLLLQYYLNSPYGEQGKVSMASPVIGQFLKQINPQ